MKQIQQTVLYEEAMDLDFLEEVHAIPGGEKGKECIQCGTCSGSCPVSWAMDHTPRQIIAMIRAGMRKEVLDSPTIWTCASCYSCAVNCPREIKLTDVMYILKRMAIKDGYEGSNNAEALSQHFVDLVNQTGRNNERVLLRRYFMSTRPFGALKEVGLGWKLFRRGRLPSQTEKVKDIEGLRKLIAKALEMGGE